MTRRSPSRAVSPVAIPVKLTISPIARFEVGFGSVAAVPARRRRGRSTSTRGPPETALRTTVHAVDAAHIPLASHSELASGSFLGVGAATVPSLCHLIIMRRIAGRYRGGQEHATEHDTDQNLACRPAAAPQGLGGHAGAACQRRDNGLRGHRRAGHTSHRGNGEAAGRGRDRLHRRRRVLDGPQSRPLHRPFHRHRGARRGSGRAADDQALDSRAR